MSQATQAAPANGDYPSALMGWATVAILFILYVLSLTDRYIIALLVQPMKADLGLSDFQLSLLQGPAFALLYSACAIPIGILLDRFGRKLVLYFSVTVWSIAAAMCGFAQGFAGIALARAVLGAGEAGFSTGAYSVIGDSFRPDRVSFAMSIFVMGGVMGAGFVFLLGGPLVAALHENGAVDLGAFGTLEPWRQAFILTGIPGVFLAFLIFFFREKKRPPGQVVTLGYGEAFSYVKKNWKFYFAVFVGISVVFAVTIGLQLWTPAFLIRIHGWEPARIGIVMGIAQILAATTLPLHGWIVDKLYGRGMKTAHFTWVMGSTALGIIVGSLAYLVPDPMIAVALFGLFMACGMAASSIGPALVQIATPAHLRGRVSAMFVVCTGLIAMGLGPTTVGFITNYVLRDEMKVGWSLIISLCVVLPIAIAVLSLGRTKLQGMIEAASPAPAAG
ncbi:permeases of the major facilitator superfamily [alpha proteobacterium U9-1i]|nr:permeases of the major facilitator superfamily [alpha proteobacterium U9-1i]